MTCRSRLEFGACHTLSARGSEGKYKLLLITAMNANAARLARHAMPCNAMRCTSMIYVVEKGYESSHYRHPSSAHVSSSPHLVAATVEPHPLLSTPFNMRLVFRP